MSNFIFKMPTLADWAKQVLERETPRYLIQGVLPADNVVLLSGAPKDAKKTWLAMLMAFIVATGKSVGSLVCTDRKPVLYIYMEQDEPGTLDRFRALAAGHGFGDLDDMSNLYLMHREGFLIDDDAHVAEIFHRVQALGIGLVVIDTLAKTMRSDENSSQHIGNAFRCAEKIRSAGCSVVLVHHLRKESVKLSMDKYGEPEPDADIRGSNAIAGSYETHWAVRSYPVVDSVKKQTYLLVRGKESDWKQADYGFNFESHDEEKDGATTSILDAATLELGEWTGLREVERPAPASRAKKDKE